MKTLTMMAESFMSTAEYESKNSELIQNVVKINITTIKCEIGFCLGGNSFWLSLVWL
jgi:hypothetical protein